MPEVGNNIQITSDGSAKGTKIVMDGVDMTKTYKTTYVSFHSSGGYRYRSSYDNREIISLPSVSFNVDYVDAKGRAKSIYSSTIDDRSSTTTGIGEDKTKTPINTSDADELKEMVLDSMDTFRDICDSLPKRLMLEKRSVESVYDTYTDMLNDLELNKESKDKK